MSVELYYWEKGGDLYSHGYPALRVEGREVLALVDDEWEPLLAHDVFGGWTRWRDDKPVSDVAIGHPPGRNQQKDQVELLLVDERGLVLAQKRCARTLSLFPHGGKIALHLSISPDDRTVHPLAQIERKSSRWVALPHWELAEGLRGQLVIAGPGVQVPGLLESLELAAPGPRSRPSALAERSSTLCG